MSSIRNNEAYVFSDGLMPLRAWLKDRLVDVRALKSERQVFFFAIKLANEERTEKTRIKIKMPKPHEPCFPALLKLQTALCGEAPKRAA